MSDLNDDEFIFFEDGGNYVLISNLGTKEYQCTGSCFCEQILDRRVTGSLSRKALFFLIASVSSIFALKQAKQYFEEKCHQDFECEHTVRSEVNDCEELGKSQEEDSVTPPKTSGKNVKRFLCHGKCLANIYHNDPVHDFEMDESHNPYAIEYGCEKLKMEGELEIDFDDWYAKLDNEKEATNEYVAGQYFIVYDFDDFCFENSYKEIPTGDTLFKCNKEYEPGTKKEDHCKFLWELDDPNCVGCEFHENEGETHEFPMCAGSDRRGQNPNVVCKEIPRKVK